MGCRSDYLEPTDREKESVRVIGFLKEVGVSDRWVGQYGDIKSLDDDTKTLCDYCQTNDVSNCSLELQIWWRDHQEADKKRLEKEMQDAKDERERGELLARLTDREKRLLGIRD